MIKPKSALALTLLAGVSLFLAAPAPGNADYFLKLGDIEGMATDTRHKDWIPVMQLHLADINIGIGEHEERRESGEKGGTEDINIGIGELQEDDASTVDYWKGLFDTADDNSLTLVNRDGEGPDLAPLFREAMANNGQFEDLVVIAGINGNSCNIHLNGVEITGYLWRASDDSGDPVPMTEQLSIKFDEVKFEMVGTARR